jgi:hypothetical protein
VTGVDNPLDSALSFAERLQRLSRLAEGADNRVFAGQRSGESRYTRARPWGQPRINLESCPEHQ